MKIYDITLSISNSMPLWPGDPPVRLERAQRIVKGDPCNVSAVSMGVHTGTHIDAPYHFLEQGITVDAIPLEPLNGPCRVIETDAGAVIEKKHIERYDFDGCVRIIFKTRNSELWKNGIASFNEDFVALGLSAAEYLVEKRLSLVGIDYLSIESFRPEEGNPVHKTLLKNNIFILEGLDLSAVPAGEYELICLPLKLEGADGAPARVVLREKY